MMKLITHNMLTSTIIKGVKKGFPLGITVSLNGFKFSLKMQNTYYRSTTGTTKHRKGPLERAQKTTKHLRDIT